MAKLNNTAEKADTPTLIKMVRDAEQYPKPHSADVHPDEVENYLAGGWEVAQEK